MSETEYQLMRRIGINDHVKYKESFRAMGQAISNGDWEYLNVDVLQSRINEAFVYVRANIRFQELVKSTNGELSMSINGFYLGQHKFETLDEVERAWKNKAFL